MEQRLSWGASRFSASKKFHALSGFWVFFVVFMKVPSLQLLSWARWIVTMSLHHVSLSICKYFPTRFAIKILYAFLSAYPTHQTLYNLITWYLIILVNKTNCEALLHAFFSSLLLLHSSVVTCLHCYTVCEHPQCMFVNSAVIEMFLMKVVCKRIYKKYHFFCLQVKIEHHSGQCLGHH